jgi:hypothetical protein
MSSDTQPGPISLMAKANLGSLEKAKTFTKTVEDISNGGSPLNSLQNLSPATSHEQPTLHRSNIFHWLC